MTSITSSGRSRQHGTLGNLCTEVNVLLWILKEVDELHDFDLRLLAASNIAKNKPEVVISCGCD